jgi:DNA helicase HerA-like ATPase
VFRANRSELAMAYACDTESSIRVGHIQQDPTIPAMIKVDEMLGKHFSILGTTGTGKSCTVALILRRILEKNPQAHILLLDVHREYAHVLPGHMPRSSPRTT